MNHKKQMLCALLTACLAAGGCGIQTENNPIHVERPVSVKEHTVDKKRYTVDIQKNTQNIEEHTADIKQQTKKLDENTADFEKHRVILDENPTDLENKD